MADGTGGVAGNAILTLVQNASDQLQDLIKRSSKQLRDFVAQSLAQIDQRQKEAEAKLEAATKAAEERARAAADDALAKMQAEMDAMRSEMAEHRAELHGIQGLADKKLSIGDIGFDFDGDGEPDTDGQEYYETQAPMPSAANQNAPSAVDLESVAQRVFDRLAAEIEAGRLRTGIARDDSVYLMTKPDFRDFVEDAVRGDERSNELAARFFWLVLAIHHMLNDDFEAAREALAQIESDHSDFDGEVASCVDERMREFDEARS